MSWDDDFPGARASRPRSQVPNQQLINPFIAVHSCPFVVRRSPSCLSSWPFVEMFLPFPGNPFPPSRPLADPSQASSNPLESLRRSSWPFVDIFLPFPGNLFSPARPLAEPSRAFSNAFVALRRSSWPFVDIFLPFPGNPFPPSRPLADPSQASSNPLVALRRSSWPFVDISLPFPGNPFPPSRPLADPSKPSPTPSWPFAVLRGPSWISFCLFLEILSPLPDHWRIPLKPPPTPWWPFVVLPAPSWITLFLSPHKFVPHPIDWAGYPVRSRLWVEPVWPTKSSGCPIGRFHDRKTRHPSRLFRGTGADL